MAVMEKTIPSNDASAGRRERGEGRRIRWDKRVYAVWGGGGDGCRSLFSDFSLIGVVKHKHKLDHINEDTEPTSSSARDSPQPCRNSRLPGYPPPPLDPSQLTLSDPSSPSTTTTAPSRVQRREHSFFPPPLLLHQPPPSPTASTTIQSKDASAGFSTANATAPTLVEAGRNEGEGIGEGIRGGCRKCGDGAAGTRGVWRCGWWVWTPMHDVSTFNVQRLHSSSLSADPFR
ncbi:hypothetical protein DFP72DRAFT_602551 [Ephemerocybe angulata]|uniref:Uncharacterized protein n=1 Tax=Ephemerocybe angulata TaxID=980116 RepID=A0A8H6MAU2_9AGAR|nr:hypothetical protein DFP72DRAFT_602551 [Tulosesus angulatus]